MAAKPSTDVNVALADATTARREAEMSRVDVAALVARIRGQQPKT
jgi:hypothetical protein